MRARFLLSLLLLTLACHRHPAATPATVLPAVALTRVAIKSPAETASANFWIPRTAIVQRGGIAGVFIAQDGQARFRMLRLGHARERQVEVLAGLRGDETLLIGDLAATHDGSPLQDSAHGK